MSKKPIEETLEALGYDNTPGSALKELYREMTSDDMADTMGILFDDLAESGEQYAINVALKMAEGVARTGRYYDQIIDSKPEYAKLKGATVIVMKRPREDDSEETKALHDLFLKAWAEAVALRKEQEAAGADLDEQERARQERKALQESINAGLAALAVRPNTAVSNALLDAEMFSEKYKEGRDLVTYRKNKEEITTYVAVSVKDNANIKTPQPLTEFEDAVQVAVNSLIYDRDRAGLLRVFSLDQICRQLLAIGDAKGRKISPKIKENVSDLIENKLSVTKVEIDATDELRARGVIGPDDPWTVEGPILPLSITEYGSIGGHPVKLYHFGQPVLLEYAKLNRQLITTPIDALAIYEISERGEIMYDCPVKLSEDRIAIRNYLWRRIEIMRSDNDRARDAWRKNEWRRKKDNTIEKKSVDSFQKQAHVILFSTLAKEVPPADNKQARRNKEFAVKVLQNWKATGLIKSYIVRYRGKAKKQMDAIERITF